MKNIICYVDGENKANLTHFKPYNNVRYLVFLGKNQKDKIKSEQGVKLKKIRCESDEKQFLDCKLIEYFLNRRNTKNTIHYIVSEDGGYDKCISYVNALNGDISCRIKNFDNF